MTETTRSETFDITISGQYKSWEIPPRCRNGRDVPRDTTTVVSVPVVAVSAAPVVITDVRGSFPVDYRLHDGDLYELSRLNRDDRRVIEAGSDDYPDTIDRQGAWSFPVGSSPEDFAAEVAKGYRNDIVIDGQVWTRTEEPRYVVQTFGLGHNHGGSGLFGSDGDNPNIAASSYFRADQFEQAQAYAIQVAENRDDNESIPGIRKMKPLFVVHDPEALRLVVPPVESEAVREARRQLHAAAREYADVMKGQGGGDTAEAKAYRTLTVARADLALLTDSITWEASERRPYEEGRTSIWS